MIEIFGRKYYDGTEILIKALTFIWISMIPVLVFVCGYKPFEPMMIMVWVLAILMAIVCSLFNVGHTVDAAELSNEKEKIL